MLIVVLPLLALFYYFAWRYRANNQKAHYDPNQSHPLWKEIFLWLIPAAVIAVLAPLSWKAAHALDPYKSIATNNLITNNPITIQVIALPWKWLFIYPAQNIATVNFVVFPERTPIRFELTADGPNDAPMSSFWIPQLGSQIYAMAAMETELNLMADSTGEFVGKDTEINGEGYAGMTFKAESVSQDDFNNWVQSIKQSSGTLDWNVYNNLLQPSVSNPPAYYSSVASHLFEGVIMKYMSPKLNVESTP